MKARTNDWLVGAVVLIVMALIVSSTLYLQEAELGDKRRTVTARFRDVGNVAVGNTVVIRGVHAGRVEQISLADNGWVTIQLSLDQGIELPQDPVVLVQSATLFGEWQALITRRDAAPKMSEVVAALRDTVNAPLGTLPGAVLPDIAQLTTVAGGIAGNVRTISDRVQTAFDSTAATELRSTIRNFSLMSTELTRAVRAQSQNLDVIAGQVREGLGDLTASASTLQRSITRLDSATSRGEISQIVNETQRAAVNMRQTTERLNSIAQSLEASETNLRSILVRTDTLMGRVERGQGTLGLLFNDPQLYRNSDSLIFDLRKLIQDFQRDPKKYINLRVF